MLYVQENYVDRTRDLNCGETDVYETYTDDRGELFRAMQKEYGRCTGKVYIGEGTAIGWVFQKIQRYTDTNEPYLAETWITVHSGEPVKAINYNYAPT